MLDAISGGRLEVGLLVPFYLMSLIRLVYQWQKVTNATVKA